MKKYTIKDLIDTVEIPTGRLIKVKGDTAYYRLHNGQVISVSVKETRDDRKEI